MPYYYGYFDPTYILIVIAFILSLIASFGVKITFSRFEKVKTARGITGAAAARRILDMNGLRNIDVERISGELTDHYDPKDNVIRLSDSTYDNTSVAAVGVAAHEAGHAVQHAVGYKPIRIRNSIIPVVNIGSSVAIPIFFIGLVFNATQVSLFGVLLYSLILLFQIVTLPVEINASRRAIKILSDNFLLYEDEVPKARKVLFAAAMTYVASVASTALQVLRLLLIVNTRRRND